MYVLSVIRASLTMLSPKQRYSFIFLLGFFLLSALVQVVGIASIGPFIALLSNPESIYSNNLFLSIYNYFNFSNSTEFIIAIAFGALFMLVLSNVVSVFTLWILMKFSIVVGESIQRSLFRNLLLRPYLFHKSSNYSESVSIINQECPRFVYMVLQPILHLISNSFIAGVILVGLIYLNPTVAFLSGGILGGTYLLTFLILKKSLRKHGDVITERNTNVQKILSESFIGIKEVKLSRLENSFIEEFRDVNRRGLKSSFIITLAGDLPKFVIETVAFSVIFIVAIVALLSAADTSKIIPILSIYAIAGYKLLPTLQQVYKSLSTIGAHGSVTHTILYNLNQPVVDEDDADCTPLERVDSVELRNISFQYPNSAHQTLSDVDVTFRLGAINTVAGRSGSGKSTLIDILLGLIRSDTGKIFINDEPASPRSIAQMQKAAGYVAQSIFIADDSVISNVAFGDLRPSEEDVVRALKQADAWDFVSKLNDGVHTSLGQDGKLLSGGQRQKIGIARSLYRNPKILILDEPTSALDIESEHDFMQLLIQLKQEILIVVISHRPSAIKCSDLITLISEGKVEAHGSLSDLRISSEAMVSMLEKGNIQ